MTWTSSRFSWQGSLCVLIEEMLVKLGLRWFEPTLAAIQGHEFSTSEYFARSHSHRAFVLERNDARRPVGPPFHSADLYDVCWSC